MRYMVLAELYQELERISAKLKKTELIANLLKETPSELLPKVVLLVMGRVSSAESEAETGVANQLMVKAISRAFGAPEEEVGRRFRETGDLGSVAEHFSGKKKQMTLGSRSLDVEHVFSEMVNIGKQEGKGSQDRKLDIVRGLLTHSKPKEALYIARTVLETLRIGVAEGIVRDAIAQAFGVDKKAVEDAWFLRPDYGEIARIAKEKGESGLKKVSLELGRPVNVLLAEKSPGLKDALESFEHPSMEIKYDGMRVQIHKKGEKVWIFTRRLENVTKAFPDLVELARKHIKPEKAILEGETLAIEPKTGRPMPFQMLSTRIKRKHDIGKSVDEIPIQVNLFDMVYLDGKSLFQTTLRERQEKLKEAVKQKEGKFQLAERLITKDLKKAEDFYQKALLAGQEGVMVKNLDAIYQPGRRVAGGWLKVKPVMETLDLAIIGATWGTGKRAGYMGSYILGCRDQESGKFLECGMLGTGIKEKKAEKEDVTLEELTEMLKPLIEKESAEKAEIRPKIVVEVAYEEIQKSPTYSSGWALRFPRLIRLRPDKSAHDADTLERVEALHSMQKGKSHK